MSAQQSLHIEPMLRGLLSHAREMFSAEVAEITLMPPSPEDVALRATSGPDGHTEVLEPVALDPREGVWSRVLADGQGVLLPRPMTNDRLKDHFDSRGIRDAIVAPLHGETGIVGTILVGNRTGGFATFDRHDLRMLETLANHVSVSLQNVRLVDELRDTATENEFLALHDTLTGFPKRALFIDRVRQGILTARREGSTVAVMLMDLDRFKEVNDTLGHHNGDLLLQGVASRLQTTLRESDTATRAGRG